MNSVVAWPLPAAPRYVPPAPEDWQFLRDHPEVATVYALRLEFRRAPVFIPYRYVSPRHREITARPKDSLDASDWIRTATALERFFDGRASRRDLTEAMAHERETITQLRSPLPAKPPPRFRPERQKEEPLPPSFTPEELAKASQIIEECCKGPLIERAWLELRSPPRRCKPTNSFERLVKRAIERARKRLRDDACRKNRRAGKITLDGVVDNSSVYNQEGESTLDVRAR